jgi:asparagine synthase (glutamine-hydrolysing)
LKSILGPLAGPVSSGMTLVNPILSSSRLSKYAPLLKLPFDDYYYGRTYSPRSYFNSQFAELYSDDFRAFADKEFSVAPGRKYLNNGRATGTLNRMLYTDTKMSLPDDLLLKADKMTMANSIELRVPFLDHKVLEFAASLPERFKIRGLTTKYLAKRALRNHVPREILQRKKVGFPVPYESWLRTELRGWMFDVLFDRETLSRGYFNKNAIEKLAAENLRTGAYSKELLALVSLELWHRAFLKKTPLPLPDREDLAAGVVKH